MERACYIPNSVIDFLAKTHPLVTFMRMHFHHQTAIKCYSWNLFLFSRRMLHCSLGISFIRITCETIFETWRVLTYNNNVDDYVTFAISWKRAIIHLNRNNDNNQPKVRSWKNSSFISKYSHKIISNNLIN